MSRVEFHSIIFYYRLICINESLIVGGISGAKGFLGCMKEIVINGIKIDPLGWKLNEVN